MEYPIQFIPDIAVKLSAYQALLRGEHIMHIRTAWTGGIEKPDFSFTHILYHTRN
ncbi:hypothetical protein AGMMS50268_08000 [Spirochaetia bacterium]|nr:hypothetical protein AGMMS50268_08000 [Spirochaetia bacterium]